MQQTLAPVQVIIDVGLLGFVYHWGLEVNSITVIGKYVLSGDGQILRRASSIGLAYAFTLYECSRRLNSVLRKGTFHYSTCLLIFAYPRISSNLRTELIMAVGLVVDYMVHIVHYFLHQV